MPTQLWAIARNTFTESIRQPIYTVVLLLGSVLLALNTVFSSFTLEDDTLQLIDLGLSTMLLAGMFLAAFTASGVLGREIENRTVLTSLSKPVSRTVFLVGKFLGTVGALACAQWVWAMVLLLTVRHGVQMRATDRIDVPVMVFGIGAFGFAVLLAVWRNYRHRRVFTSGLTVALVVASFLGTVAALSFDKEWQPQAPWNDLDPQLLLALVLVLEAVVVLGAVALATATRLGQLANLVVCFGVLLLGLLGDFLLLPHVDTSWLAHIAYTVLPNFQFLWIGDALQQQSPVSLTYLVEASGYALLYVVAVLGIAVALFEERELG